MSTVNWDLFKCRCSAISKILANGVDGRQITEKQEEELKKLEDKETITPKQKEEMERLRALKAKKGMIVLGDTAITYLMEVFALETEGMIPVSKESMDILSMSKGKKQEAQAGALLSFVDNVTYKVHKDRISNEFLSGEIDLYLGNDVYSASCVPDIKNSWDYPGFLKKINAGLEQGQKEQEQGYGDITGATDLFVANCLVDCTEQNIEEVKYRVSKKFGAVTIESPEFLEEWKKWERSMIFNHIDPYKRVHKIPVTPFTEFERQKVYDRVKFCREFLWKFDAEHENRNKYIPSSEISEVIENTEGNSQH
jgi:hypothetical protein